MFRLLTGALFVTTLMLSTSLAHAEEALKPRVYRLSPEPGLQYRLQEMLVQTVPGDVIEFSEGRFALTRQIDIATDNITIRGQGEGKTILSFKGQLSGGQGIEATGNNFVMERLAIEDTAGNAIKVVGSRNVTFRDVRVEWTGEPKSSNGAYGLYPVQCSNVLLENCQAYGASDAGVYVGQCRTVIVRGCRAERNVAGIEIENTVGADVYDNVSTNNAAGLLVFDLPGLQLKAGRNVRVHRNRVFANNHKNFAAKGNMVATVPSGTGMMVMATDHVEVFDNDIQDNQTTSIALVSYLASGKKLKDTTFDPVPEAASIHDNRVSGGGTNPQGELGKALVPVLGTPLPEILFDGIYPEDKLVDGEVPDALQHSIVNNGDASFINFDLPNLSLEKVAAGKYKPSRDLTPFLKPRPALASIELQPHDPPTSAPAKAVIAYRTAPKLLSEYGLFEGNGSTQQPAEGVVPYTLNTTLFSDYTAKYRFIRVPDGSSFEFVEHGMFDFPEGTVIAKTFSYPHDMTDPTKGERLLETRIELLQDGEWYGFSYRWNDEQTDATLSLGGGEMEVEWIHHDGTKRTNHYEIPNPNQCLNCHSQNKVYVPIGPTADNMDREAQYGDEHVNQLEHLANLHWLKNLPAAEDREPLPIAYDESTGTLDERAHAWLHVNCAHCHSPEGIAGSSGLDLRYSQADPTKFGVWKAPVAAGHGSGGREYDIVPGEPDESILLFRMESDDPSIRMPNVARSIVPEEAVELIREWIAAMPKEN